MPYISEKDRKLYDIHINNLISELKLLGFPPGHLNYIVSRMVGSCFNQKPSYGKGNDIMGMLDGVGKEFYRRKLGPLEDQKIKENGDIPEYSDPSI